MLAWKRQKLRIPPTANYSDIKNPISLPPGKTWCRDIQTNEWKVVDVVESPCVWNASASTTATDWSPDAAVVVTVADDVVVRADSNHDHGDRVTCGHYDVMYSRFNGLDSAPTAAVVVTESNDNHDNDDDHNNNRHDHSHSVLNNRRHNNTNDEGLGGNDGIAMDSDFAAAAAPITNTAGAHTMEDCQLSEARAAIDTATAKATTCHYHIVQPSDTLQGICLRYGITATELRQWNVFSGSNLALAPSMLQIRQRKRHVVSQDSKTSLSPSWKENMQEKEKDEKQYKIQLFQSTMTRRLSLSSKFQCCSQNGNRMTGGAGAGAGGGGIGKQEAVAYLDMNQWNVDDAVLDALQDYGWENAANSEKEA